MPTLFDNPGGNTYGAFSWGDTRFVLLDCGEDKPDDHWVYYGLNDFSGFRREQADFLRREISSKPFKRAKRRVLINHIPIWGNTDKYQPCRDMWAPILRKAGNPCPNIVGGGPSMKRSTLMVLSKRGKNMTLRVLNAEGEEVDKLDL